jgi:hypothetical protein
VILFFRRWNCLLHAARGANGNRERRDILGDNRSGSNTVYRLAPELVSSLLAMIPAFFLVASSLSSAIRSLIVRILFLFFRRWNCLLHAARGANGNRERRDILGASLLAMIPAFFLVASSLSSAIRSLSKTTAG